MAKKLRIVLVIVGVMMMVATWGGIAAGAQEIDVAVIRARQGQYLVVARDGEPRVDVAVIRARLGQYLVVARDGEPRVDVALARSLPLASQPIGEAFARSVALTDQSPAGYVAASGPVIGQSIFPGEAVAQAGLDKYLETAMGSEPQVDVAVIRARQGQYREAVFGGR